MLEGVRRRSRPGITSIRLAVFAAGDHPERVRHAERPEDARRRRAAEAGVPDDDRGADDHQGEAGEGDPHQALGLGLALGVVDQVADGGAGIVGLADGARGMVAADHRGAQVEEALDRGHLADVMGEAQGAVHVGREDPAGGAEGGQRGAVDDPADALPGRRIGDEGARLGEVAGDHLLGPEAGQDLGVADEAGQRAHHALVGVGGVLAADQEQHLGPFRGAEQVGREGAAEESRGAGDEDGGLRVFVVDHGGRPNVNLGGGV